MKADLVPRRRKIDASIDMTPLIDVVFQLLIFLMVSSHFTKPDVQVDLPTGQGQATAVDREVQRHVVVITADDTISLNDDVIALAAFDQALRAAIQQTGSKRLEIRGDQGSSLGIFIDLIERAKQAGIDSLSYHKKQPASE